MNQTPKVAKKIIDIEYLIENYGKDEKPPKKFPNKYKICSICSNDKKGKYVPLNKEVVKLYKEKVFLDKICKDCNKIIKEGVSLSCVGEKEDGSLCDSFSVIGIEKMKELLPSIKKGDVVTMSSCPSCNKKEGFKIKKIERKV